jgi:hypothetical protein
MLESFHSKTLFTFAIFAVLQSGKQIGTVAKT